jgi:hypothetical protein
MLGVWNIRVVRAVSVFFDGVRGAKDVKDCARRDGPEPVHVAPCRRVQDRRVARRSEIIIHNQFGQPHCKKINPWRYSAFASQHIGQQNQALW